MIIYEKRDRLFGNIYPDLTENEIGAALVKQIRRLGLAEKCPAIISVFKELWESKFWRYTGYDGASIVTDVSHPAIWNFIHDWMYRTGMGGLESDVIYRELMILGGISKVKAYRRYYVIRVAWLLYFKRKHKKSGNVRDLSDNCVLLYNSLK